MAGFINLTQTNNNIVKELQEKTSDFATQEDIANAVSDLASQESLTAVALQVAELSAQIGDISTLLDTINGEVV